MNRIDLSAIKNEENQLSIGKKNPITGINILEICIGRDCGILIFFDK